MNYRECRREKAGNPDGSRTPGPWKIGSRSATVLFGGGVGRAGIGVGCGRVRRDVGNAVTAADRAPRAGPAARHLVHVEEHEDLGGGREVPGMGRLNRPLFLSRIPG